MTSILDRLTIVRQELALPRPPMRFSAQLDGEEVGRAHLYEIRESIHPDPRDQYGYVGDVFVEPELRGQKVGEAIMDDVHVVEAERDYYKSGLWTEHLNGRAMRLYLNMGYDPLSVAFRFNFREPYSHSR